MHGERARCIGDDCPYGVTDESEEEDIRVLLEHIRGFYKVALDRLPVESIPSLAPSLLKAGMCFGVLDPVSNIIANTIAYYSAPPKMPRGPEEEEKNDGDDDDETRCSILCKIKADAHDRRIYNMFLSPKEMNGMTIARRSLQGLVSFLTFHFRYFSYTEAIRYLRLAGADLLIAMRLIKLDHCKSLDFNFTSPTARIALFCAAMSAAHPRPAVLLRAAMSLGSRMVMVNNLLLSGDRYLTPKSIKHLTKWLGQDAKSLKEKLKWLPMSLAESRHQDRQEKKRKRDVPTPVHKQVGTFAYTQSLKLLLLVKIHALYLEALALMPRDALLKRHHCNLIKGGYCYGPMDPVSNIILNTIWYGATFPMPQQFDFNFDANMICTRSLDRVECCSLYGLVAFLRTRFPTLTETDSLLYLLKSNADIGKSVEQIEQDGHALSVSYLDGLKVAAVHSWHPDPDALLSSVGVHSTDFSFMRDSTIRYSRLERLVSSLLPKSSPANSEEYAQQLSKASSSSVILNENQKMLIPAAKEKFKADQGFFVKKVNAVLKKFSQQKGVDYELHIICGVNIEVTERSSVDLFKRNFKYEYFHINFLATAKGSNNASASPELFFAECSNSDNDEEKRPSLCFPVKCSWVDDARCFCCEMNGIKIVHPYLEKYHGLYDFKKIASREHGVLNDHIISAYDLHADRMCTIQDDWIYFNPEMDALIAEKNPIEDWARKIREWGRVF
ncbi:hypothetical protein ACQ4PT_029596 [Festuca glaucescens]